MDELRLNGFQARTVNKVERLLDLLEEIQTHPASEGKLLPSPRNRAPASTPLEPPNLDPSPPKPAQAGFLFA